MANEIKMGVDFSDESQPVSPTPVEEEEEEVKEPQEDAEATEEETETPTEPPAEEEPAEEEEETPPSEDISRQRQISGLKEERDRLLTEIRNLRQERRDVRTQQAELAKVEETIDELKDVNPNDVQLIERVLKSKGYVKKDDAEKLVQSRTYETTKQRLLDDFLSKHPEYKPENDPNDTKWNALQREIGLYRTPNDPNQIASILERSHKEISKSTDGGDVAVKRRLAETAGKGGGGARQPSSKGSVLTEWQKQQYRRGGWSEEEIAEMNK